MCHLGLGGGRGQSSTFFQLNCFEILPYVVSDRPLPGTANCLFRKLSLLCFDIIFHYLEVFVNVAMNHSKFTCPSRTIVKLTLTC